jgi:hypothetical protein
MATLFPPVVLPVLDEAMLPDVTLSAPDELLTTDEAPELPPCAELLAVEPHPLSMAVAAIVNDKTVEMIFLLLISMPS